MTTARVRPRKNQLRATITNQTSGHASMTIDSQASIDLSLLAQQHFLVGLGNINPSQQLDSILKLFHKLNHYHNKFRRIDILLTGVLQRHFFWTLSEKLPDKDLAELLSDISPDSDIEGVAATLASKFYSIALKEEDKYFFENYPLIKALTAILPNFIRCGVSTSNAENKNVPDEKEDSQFLKWEEIEAATSSSYDTFFYYELLQIFPQAIEESVKDYIRGHDKLISSQAKRIIGLNPALKKFFNEPLKLAKICSRNFILEECNFLFLAQSQLQHHYQSLLYPRRYSEAFKTIQRLCSSKLSYIEMRLETKDDDFVGYSFDLQKDPEIKRSGSESDISGLYSFFQAKQAEESKAPTTAIEVVRRNSLP